MPRHPPLTILVAIALTATSALAGCLTDADTDAQSNPPELDPPATSAETTHEAVRITEANAGARSSYDVDDWFLLSGPRHPEGHVRAFQFKLPDNAVQDVVDGAGLAVVYLEVVPLENQLAPGQDWDLFAFRAHGGSAQLLFSLYGATLHVENLTTDPPTREIMPPVAMGRTYLVSGDGIADGDDVYFILVGYGDPSDEISFALRIRFAAGREMPQAAPTFTAFTQQVATKPIAPRPIWDGVGAYNAVFGEVLTTDGPRMRAATANVEYSIDPLAAPPTALPANPGDKRLYASSTAATGPGWSYIAAHHDAGSEAITWSLDLSAQGTLGQSNGATIGVPVAGMGSRSDPVTGMPSALYLADGDGPSYVTLELEGAIGDYGSSTYIHHARLPAPLLTILGVPSDHFEGLYEGEAGGLPWLDDLPPARE